MEQNMLNSIQNTSRKLCSNASFLSLMKKPKYILIFLAFFYDTIVFYGVWILQKVPLFNYLLSVIFPVITLLLFCFLLKGEDKKRITLSNWLFVFFIILIVSFSMLINKNSFDIIWDRFLPRLFAKCIPFFFLGLLFDPDDKTTSFIGKISIFSICLGVIYVIYMLYFSGSQTIGEDNMELSYRYAFVEMIVIIYSLRKRSIIGFFVSLIGFVLIVSLGTRGPVLMLLVFILMCIFKSIFEKKKNRIFWFVAIFMILGFTIIFAEQIASLLNTLFNELGLSTRVTSNILSPDSISDSGRSQIAAIVVDKILENPVFGYGIAGEWQFVNWNAHNLYLSFFIQFGIPVGVVAIIYLLLNSIRVFSSSKNENARFLILMFFSLVFVKGFFNGEPLTLEVFFLLGFSIGQSRQIQANNTKRNRLLVSFSR